MVKVDKVISMLHLRQLLPRTVFETCFSGEGVTFKKSENIFITKEI